MTPVTLDSAAEDFVRLALAVGQHDADYVDAYFGPDDWRSEVEAESLDLQQILASARELSRQIATLPAEDDDPMNTQRHRRLARTIDTLVARASYLSGDRLRFDEESAALFDAVAPTHTAEHFQSILDQLDAALAGEGSLLDRYGKFKYSTDIIGADLNALHEKFAAYRERFGLEIEQRK